MKGKSNNCKCYKLNLVVIGGFVFLTQRKTFLIYSFAWAESVCCTVNQQIIGISFLCDKSKRTTERKIQYKEVSIYQVGYNCLLNRTTTKEWLFS